MPLWVPSTSEPQTRADWGRDLPGRQPTTAERTWEAHGEAGWERAREATARATTASQRGPHQVAQNAHEAAAFEWGQIDSPEAARIAGFHSAAARIHATAVTTNTPVIREGLARQAMTKASAAQHAAAQPIAPLPRQV